MAGRIRGYLERMLGRRETAGTEGVTDSELLGRFAATGDEAAFELLVWRHGAMVLGLCRRAIRDEHLAEDAFQAVFLVLARKPSTVRGTNVGGWLFRIARRVAARALRNRLLVQTPVEQPCEPQPCATECQELTELLDAEVSRLPERLRRPVILCYLGGRSTEDAARELGCPRGTILSRLAAARKVLAERLTRRGVTLPAVLPVAGFVLPGRLVSQTVALGRSPYHLPAHSGPTLLAESVVRAMTATKLATVCAALLLMTGLTLAVGLGTTGPGANDKNDPNAVAAQTGQPPAKGAEQKDAKPADKAAELRRKADEIAARIDQLQARLAREVPEDGALDVSVLQAELFEVGKKTLAAENQLKAKERNLADAVKDKEAAPKWELPEFLVTQEINAAPAVQTANRRVFQAKQAATRVEQQQLGPDHPVTKAASKELADAEAEIKAAREKARPEAEKKVRDELLRNADVRLTGAKHELKAASDALDDLRANRRQLLERITKAKLADAKRQAIQDELNVLRDIQLELLRQRTLAELGLEGLQSAPRRQADSKSEGQMKELRREIEALRGEIGTKSAAQTKELRGEIEALRGELEKLRRDVSRPDVGGQRKK